MKRKTSSFLGNLTLFCLVPMLGGCNELILFDPKGPIGESEKFLILFAFVSMLVVVVPVIIMSIVIPLKYRESNVKAPYDPGWDYSFIIEVAMWVVPLVIVSVLSVLAWKYTHRLDPYVPIKSESKPLNVEVVSLNWKWLFIYPDYEIAVVNQFVFPVKIPLNFKLTSDTVMTSFFIPQLGSQIYAMAGMETRLHLLADEKGVFRGQNQQFSGAGFSDMTFKAKADSQEMFDSWVQQVKQSRKKLDFASLDELTKPGTSDSVLYYSSIEPGLFEHIIKKYSQARSPNGSGGAAHPHAN